jgi:hypothetical protein
LNAAIRRVSTGGCVRVPPATPAVTSLPGRDALHGVALGCGTVGALPVDRPALDPGCARSSGTDDRLDRYRTVVSAALL